MYVWHIRSSFIASKIDQYLFSFLFFFFSFKLTFLWLFSRIRYFASLSLTSLLSRWICKSLFTILFKEKGCLQFSYLLWFSMVYVIMVNLVETRRKLNNWQHALSFSPIWVCLLYDYYEVVLNLFMPCVF